VTMEKSKTKTSGRLIGAASCVGGGKVETGCLWERKGTAGKGEVIFSKKAVKRRAGRNLQHRPYRKAVSQSMKGIRESPAKKEKDVKSRRDGKRGKEPCFDCFLIWKRMIGKKNP